jgi:putative spermidine/putrescine transport system substrate-binding protein
MKALILSAIAALVVAGCGGHTAPPSAGALARMPWDSVLARARGQEVIWRMWRGDPAINAYVDHWVAPRVKDRFGIALTAVAGEGPEITNQLLAEKRAGSAGRASLLWINGQTFHNLRQEQLLFGPWASRLPNDRYLDSASAIVMRDFEQPLDGFESPWGRVEFALIYDSARTPRPPRSVAELHDWILAHPGRFTYDQGFTGTSFLKILLYALNGGPERFEGGFHQAVYDSASERLWQWLDEVRPALWRSGETYPADVADLHRLFANGEVDFTMSYNQNEAANKIRQGILPPTARPLLLTDGMLANAHYVGIPFNAPAPAAAMVVANFLLSPEAQLEKSRPAVWADGTVLSLGRLPPEWADSFDTVQRSAHLLSPDSLARYARAEVAPEYHQRIAADWQHRIRDR